MKKQTLSKKDKQAIVDYVERVEDYKRENNIE